MSTETGGELSMTEVAARLQHTLIGTGLTRERMHRHADECVRHGFHAAMVPADWVSEVCSRLDGSGVLTASALDFPDGGCMTTAGKTAEARALVESGVQQIDMGVQIGRLLSGDVQRFTDDIAAVVAAAAPVPVKVMLELPLLSAEQRDRATDAAVQAGVGYVKNASSGAVGVADPEDIAYLRARVPSGVGVKASGGIKTLTHVRSLFAAGADLAGTSDAVTIVASGQCW